MVKFSHGNAWRPAARFGPIGLIALGMLIISGSALPAQRLIVAQGTEPETLDAQATAVSAAHNVSFQITERLVLETSNGSLEPSLALKWGPIKDDRTWRFTLRPNVFFTNGEPMDAQAVKFSIERVLKPDPKWGSSVAHYVQPIESISVVDKMTVDIVTKKPFGLLPKNLVKVGIVPPDYVTRVGNVAFSRQPIGTGPFMLKEWKVGQYVLLARNDKYWGTKAILDEVEFRAIPDPQTRVSALESGDVHLITQFPVQEAARAKSARNFKMVGTPSLRNMNLVINTLKAGPLQDKRVRQALNYAVDKKTIVDKTLQGYGKVLQGQMLSEFYFGFNPALKPYPYDPKKAKELLATAGYSNGFPLELATPRGRYMNDVEVAQLIVAYLEAVGLQVTLQQYEWAPFVGMLTPKKLPELSLWGWAVTPADADSELGNNVSTHPFSYYRNPKFDAIMGRAAETSNDAQRLAAYKEATELLRDEAPNVWLYQQYDLYGVVDQVKNWKPRPDEILNLVPVSLGP
jgi:peptide/nickel transport system substrate-binding protein